MYSEVEAYNLMTGSKVKLQVQMESPRGRIKWTEGALNIFRTQG